MTTTRQRQAYALAHPLNDPEQATDPAYMHIRRHPSGLLLMSILAVDR